MEAVTLPGKPVLHICNSCGKTIMEEDHVKAVDVYWHTGCFKCCMCKKTLSTWYYERDRRLFCREDYFRKFAQGCHGCAYLITGPVMIAGDHKFHPDCFICIKCKSYIGDGEHYALVERSKLYCGHCYHDIIVSRPRKEKKKRKSHHTVQLLTIPSTPEGQKSILVEIADVALYPPSPSKQCDPVKRRSLCVVGVEEVNDTLDVCPGSRILEVNGTPVENGNLTELANVLRTSKEDVVITVEHDPDVSPEVGKENTLEPSTGNNNNKDSFTLDSPVRRKRDGMFFSPSDPNLPHLIGADLKMSRVGTLPKTKKSQTDDDIETCQFNRSMSLKTQRYQRIFRSSDLVRGEILGRGFFGQAIKVVHKDTAEVMVLKELVKFDEDAQRRFLQEAKVLRSLHHKNVLRFIGVVYREKKLSIITEFLSGGALRTVIIDPNIPLSWCQRICYARDISQGLDYLHSMKIIHRDLNSQNCLLKEDGSVVVADFGLARITVEDKSNPRLPRVQELKKPGHRKKRYTVVGNPFWMAPEMLNVRTTCHVRYTVTLLQLNDSSQKSFKNLKYSDSTTVQCFRERSVVDGLFINLKHGTRGYVYDEKVDIFSFSIIICELIGRIDADPDKMPRLSNFGLNVNLFRKLYCDNCPEVFFQIAIRGCNLNSDARPSSDVISKWLVSLSMNFEHGAPLSEELKAMNVPPLIEGSPSTEAPP